LLDKRLTSERDRKQLALEHSRRVNAGDVDALLALYGDDVTFADPVGWPAQRGREALRAHFEQSVAGNLQEIPGEPVAGQDGAHTLIPITAAMDYLPLGPVFAGRGWLAPPADPAGKRLRLTYMRLLRVDEAGLIREVQTFWGRSDIEVTG
jgi:steroid delta-isomerase